MERVKEKRRDQNTPYISDEVVSKWSKEILKGKIFRKKRGVRAQKGRTLVSKSAQARKI
jgi:hypothetical protein